MDFSAGSAKPDEVTDVLTTHTNKFVQVWRPIGQNVQEGNPHLFPIVSALVWTLYLGNQELGFEIDAQTSRTNRSSQALSKSDSFRMKTALSSNAKCQLVS